jgi:hypothetical protein
MDSQGMNALMHLCTYEHTSDNELLKILLKQGKADPGALSPSGDPTGRSMYAPLEASHHIAITQQSHSNHMEIT